MFPGARKLSSNTRKPSFFFTACMGGYLCGIIVAAGTHVVVAIAAGAHPRFTGACVRPALIALDLRVPASYFAGTMVSC